MKKILSLILVLLMLLTALPLTVSAEENGEFTYKLLSDGTVAVTGYTGKEKELEIPEIIDGYTVTKIGKSAFYKIKTLEKILIPSSVTVIKKFAFCDCVNLTEVNMNDGLKTIGRSAFSHCDKLKSVVIPDTAVALKKNVFYECKELEKVDLGEGVKTIDPSAFAKCTKLEKIAIPDSVVRVGKNAFQKTKWLDEQENGVVYVGKVAYTYKGSSPEKVTIKDGTVSIATGAFRNRYKMKEVVLPEGVEHIGKNAFYLCVSLEEITFPDSIRYVGADAMHATDWLDNYESGEVYIGKIFYRLKYTDDAMKTVTIKDGTTLIAPAAFMEYNSHTLTEVVIPDTVTEIGASAFDRCSELTKVTMSENIVKIGADAFSGCTKLFSVEIPEGTKSIGAGAFRSCHGLKEIVIPESVTYIGRAAFFACVNLVTVKLPENMNEIIPSMFAYCRSLTDVIIPQGVKTIEYNAFSGCESLTEIVLPNGLKRLKNGAFEKSGLTEIMIPDKVRSIGSFAFGNCDNLKTVHIPASVNLIVTTAFSECDSLEKFIVDESNRKYFTIDGSLFKRKATDKDYICMVQYAFGKPEKEYKVPDGVIKLYGSSFFGNKKLEKVVLSDTVEYLSGTFRNCTELKEITIPPSVKKITYRIGYLNNKKIDGFTIYGATGSAAETYAKEYGFKFVEI